MIKNLVIVESPAKSKTIGAFLGPDFYVTSSKGHIRDLSTQGQGGFGVDIENHFTPSYKNLPDKKDVIKELKKLVAQSDKVYLATDPDREGEAISWHLKEVLELGAKPYERIVFNEITEHAIKSSLAHGRDIDMDLVHSQESRRILDRIIGFSLSKLLQHKIGSKSAGRVQSVALKLVVDQEKEIQAFKKEEYWEITLDFVKDGLAQSASLVMRPKEVIPSADAAASVISSLGTIHTVKDITYKDKKKNPRPPFITSTLQQDAANRLGYPSKRTMMIAQHLYEGVEIDGHPMGLITYMRTDSVRLSQEFIDGARAIIEKTYGTEYYRGYQEPSKKEKNVQDAHEAIRPAHLEITPEIAKPFLASDEYKLYKLIWSRAFAALMAPASYKEEVVKIDSGERQFSLSGDALTFKGYLAEMSEATDEAEPKLANYVVGETIQGTPSSHQKFTQPPLRYSEARLIKKMEELGIGRPSTYSQTMEVLKTRFYVKVNQKAFIPTDQGIRTSEALDAYFPTIINVGYTAKMEEELDRIADGEDVWYDDLKAFTDEFLPLVENAQEKMPKTYPRFLDETCPVCGKPLVERSGRFGPFIACSGYPACTYIKKKETVPPKPTGLHCPYCAKGMIVERTVKRGRTTGKIFYACDQFPSCRTTFSTLPTEEELAKLKAEGRPKGKK